MEKFFFGSEFDFEQLEYESRDEGICVYVWKMDIYTFHSIEHDSIRLKRKFY